MTAYADETRMLLAAFRQKPARPVDWNSRSRFEWQADSRRWSVQQSGMGKVRAASLCQQIIDTSPVETFFEFGFAGGLVESMEIGDTVVITGVSDHDAPNRSEIQQEQERERTRLFAVSGASIERFAAVLSENRDIRVTQSTVVCGDMDIYDRALRDRIAAESGAVAVTWESSAIVDVCALNNVRYVGVRLISDLCVEADSGPIPAARLARLRTATKAYVNALIDFSEPQTT